MIRVYKSGLHFGEEPLIHGNDKSGMISFSGCMLACRFCYTPETSRLKMGQDYSPHQFFELLMELSQQGAKNINLITPSHIWSEIEKPLRDFKAATHHQLPVVLKVGGYEPPRLLERMLEVGDLWVSDFKIWDSQRALQENLPANYGARTLQGIEQIHRRFQSLQTGKAQGGSKMKQGILVRHLLMPGFYSDSQSVLQKLAEIAFTGPINLMTQFIHPESQKISTYPQESLRRLVNSAQNRSGE